MKTLPVGIGVVASLMIAAHAAPLAAQERGVPTQIMVRSLAHDAKIIGSGVGGTRITIRDVATGQVLAEGMTEGGTGSTEKIITQPIKRHDVIFATEGTAGFLATLDLARPTMVEITAVGPLGDAQATMRSSKTMLLVPGKHVLGDGVVLEIHGFTVKLELPANVQPARGKPLDVKANVTMACGCPTQPGGAWDANDIEIVARLHKEGKVVGEATLTYAGTVNTYSGQITPTADGELEVVVLAMDPKHANFGQVSRKLQVSR